MSHVLPISSNELPSTRPSPSSAVPNQTGQLTLNVPLALGHAVPVVVERVLDSHIGR